MTFKDIFKKSFLASVNTADISVKSLIFTLFITGALAVYIFFAYRILTRKTFYSKSFAISLAAIAVIVAAIILTIQSNVVISLGMVGALSIVRFRTAIKDPMDLTFLFWAISIGIICGAGLPGIALITSALLTVGIFLLNALPVAKAPMLLVINASGLQFKSAILEKIGENTKYYSVKSQTAQSGMLDMIVEIRSADGDSLVDNIASLEGVTRCSLVSHDGEVTF